MILVGRDVVDVILDVVKQEDCDLLILNWYGYTQAHGVMLSSKIDRILRESKCDLLVIQDAKPFRSVLVAVHPSAKSPYLELIGEIAGGLRDYYKPRMELFGVMPQGIPSYLRPDPTALLSGLKLDRKDFDEINFASGRSVAGGILEEMKKKNHDLVIVGAAQPKFLAHFKVGSVAEALAKDTATSLMIIRGHEGAAEAFLKRLIRPLKREN